MNNDIIICNYWNESKKHNSRFVKFLPSKGEGRIVSVNNSFKKSTYTFAWAYRYKRKWFVVWDDKTNVYMQIDKKRWKFNNYITCCVNLVSMNKRIKFQIKNGNRVEFELVYLRKKFKLHNLFDFTYDYFDETIDDFFLNFYDVCFLKEEENSGSPD